MLRKCQISPLPCKALRPFLAALLGWVAVASCLATDVSAEHIAAGALSAEPKSGILLTMAVSPKSILPLEGVITTYTLTNVTGEDIPDGPRFPPIDYEYQNLYMRRESGEFEPVTVDTWLPYSYGRITPTRPYREGEVVRRSSAVEQGGYGERKFHRGVFAEPGKYEFQLRIESADRTQTLASNVVDVEVREPEGQDAEAYRYLREQLALQAASLEAGSDRPTSGGCVLYQFPMTARHAALAEHFLEDYPESRYTNQVCINLANFWIKHDDYGQATDYLIKAASPDVGNSVRRKFQFLLSTLKQKSEADPALAELVSLAIEAAAKAREERNIE